MNGHVRVMSHLAVQLTAHSVYTRRINKPTAVTHKPHDYGMGKV